MLAVASRAPSGALPPAVGVPSPGVPVDMAAWLAHGIAAREAELELEDVNTDPDALVVTGNFLAARWGGEVHDLTKFALFSRMLRCLVEQRGAAPREGVSADALIEAIWPDERMTPESANNRFHKTLSTFRKRFGKAFVERVTCLPLAAGGAGRHAPGPRDRGYAPPPGWTHRASARTLGEETTDTEPGSAPRLAALSLLLSVLPRSRKRTTTWHGRRTPGLRRGLPPLDDPAVRQERPARRLLRRGHGGARGPSAAGSARAPRPRHPPGAAEDHRGARRHRALPRRPIEQERARLIQGA